LASSRVLTPEKSGFSEATGVLDATLGSAHIWHTKLMSEGALAHILSKIAIDPGESDRDALSEAEKVASRAQVAENRETQPLGFSVRNPANLLCTSGHSFRKPTGMPLSVTE
jgi:hypothetical protein